jgi:hypothetical protein
MYDGEKFETFIRDEMRKKKKTLTTTHHHQHHHVFAVITRQFPIMMMIENHRYN